jgi:hypothetical protein
MKLNETAISHDSKQHKWQIIIPTNFNHVTQNSGKFREEMPSGNPKRFHHHSVAAMTPRLVEIPAGLLFIEVSFEGLTSSTLRSLVPSRNPVLLFEVTLAEVEDLTSPTFRSVTLSCNSLLAISATWSRNYTYTLSARQAFNLALYFTPITRKGPFITLLGIVCRLLNKVILEPRI